MTFIWHVWKWRNKILPASSDAEAIAIRHEDIFPSVQRLSLLWAYNGSSKKVFISWKNWILNPGELASSSPPNCYSSSRFKSNERHSGLFKALEGYQYALGFRKAKFRELAMDETVILKTLPVLKHAIKDLFSHDPAFIQCFRIADLGCSSSKNTLLVAFNIINIVDEACKENDRKAPQFEVCLNDLYGNDFNNIFKLLPDFYAKLKKEKGENSGPCFVLAVPGSFYGRLFPDQSLHLVHSSYSLHWLSQVPEGLEDNRLNIYLGKTSPPNVFQAYEKQFHMDFTMFLQMRSKEIVHGGRMVLALLCRSMADLTSNDSGYKWKLLAQTLLDMVEEGLVQESDIISFNMPLYFPCEDEVRTIILNEGSFSINKLDVFQGNWDPYDTDYTNMKDSNEASQIHGKNAANVVRAVSEPLLTSHFGNSIVEEVFMRYGKYVAEHLAKKKTRYYNLVVSLTKL
ncbi:anthranilate O-methyltransferase 3 [Artemisia annua]|uniref:Anthranilate O-methyltransferase 3 n=1 Tax=Artemisia annua TaxID=35608 RepID=A0A2U1KJJ6_ARTAN|nr:anthranilate O-methyltransferase 3 [Artemisia annua]